MSNENRLYIVSFGDSRQYKLRLPGNDAARGSNAQKFVNVENELNAYLKSLFPEETFAYFTTAKVEEVPAGKEEEYASYPSLDDKAIAEIKENLRREVTNMNFQKQLDSDAPFNDVPA